MQARAIITANRDVQMVGYRGVVERFARKMKLTGFVENIRPYDVKIVCEGDKASIDSFVRLIRIKEYPIEMGTSRSGKYYLELSESIVDERHPILGSDPF